MDDKNRHCSLRLNGSGFFFGKLGGSTKWHTGSASLLTARALRARASQPRAIYIGVVGRVWTYARGIHGISPMGGMEENSLDSRRIHRGRSPIASPSRSG